MHPQTSLGYFYRDIFYRQLFWVNGEADGARILEGTDNHHGTPLIGRHLMQRRRHTLAIACPNDETGTIDMEAKRQLYIGKEITLGTQHLYLHKAELTIVIGGLGTVCTQVDAMWFLVWVTKVPTYYSLAKVPVKMKICKVNLLLVKRVNF